VTPVTLLSPNFFKKGLSFFITCDNNENVFMKGISMNLSGGINVGLVKVRNNKQGCRIFDYKHVCPFTKGNKYIILMLGTLLSEWHHSHTICREKFSADNGILYKSKQSWRV
jgi:uncharacterized protein (UPF0179 family)